MARGTAAAVELDSGPSAQLAARARRDQVAAPCTFAGLRDTLSDYLPAAEIDAVDAAYAYADQAHSGQWRLTGHPYISHPLAVAAILAQMRMDHETLMAALLHDVIEDTAVAKATLGKRFGKPVAELVDGVSKLSAMFSSHAEAQASNMQKMVLAMARDVRVVLVKIADRLHNMRTIGALPVDRRRRIARETLDYYAPIAYRLGMARIGTELEDLSFAALHPLRADRIERAVAKARGRRRALVKEARKALQAALNAEGVAAEVSGREKHLYSIYNKMKSQRKPFREIMDVFGLRVVVDDEDACYRALGVAHGLYKPVAGRFKDYIAIPKANGYQSLHTTLFGAHGAPIEVQIRTQHMAEVADHGIAGHWLYKGAEDDAPGGQRTHRWMRDLVEMQQRSGNPEEFIESFKSDLFPDNVYVFTPRGDILELPKGASPVDFAYAIHTDIGNRCAACRIDRVLSPLSQQLESGQSVEIITAKSVSPSPDWLTFAVSGKARAGIRHALKNRRRAEAIALGRKLLNRSLANAGSQISDLDFRRLRRVFKEFGARRLDDVLSAIGVGDLMAYAVAQRLLAADNPGFEAVPVEHGGPVTISGGEGLVITCSRCCGPVPGDPIVGRMTPGKGFAVHAQSCPNIAKAKQERPEQIIPARWTKTADSEFATPLHLSVSRRKGIIADLATAIAAANAGVEHIDVTERNAETSAVSVTVSVANRNHLAQVIRRMRNIPDVINIARGSA